MSGLFDQAITCLHKTLAHYIILPSGLRQAIYSKSGLERRIRRPGMFDFGDYVSKSKDIVMSWGCDHIAFDVGYVNPPSSKGAQLTPSSL
ncbi:hypothetical protein FRB99_002946 [Tulasnella sp. 403]|nr:hypothetical protein FRB99_002946 [Tulasnella sp. 403]